MHETQSNNSQLEGTGAHELLAARYLEICNPRHPGVIRCEIFIDIPEGAVVGRIDGHARIGSPRSYEGRSISSFLACPVENGHLSRSGVVRKIPIRKVNSRISIIRESIRHTIADRSVSVFVLSDAGEESEKAAVGIYRAGLMNAWHSAATVA